jgi:anti-anti-sigma regulatory factor
MASNFGISVYRCDNELRFELSGDFDGFSAHQLLSLMQNCKKESGKIFIHTDSISNIDSSGLDILRNKMGSLIKNQMQFIFTGEKAPYLTESTTLRQPGP